MLGETTLFPFQPAHCPHYCLNSWYFQICVSRQISSRPGRLIHQHISQTLMLHVPHWLFFSRLEYRPHCGSSHLVTLSFQWSAGPATGTPQVLFLVYITTDIAWVELSLLITEKLCCHPQKVSSTLSQTPLGYCPPSWQDNILKNQVIIKIPSENPSISLQFLQDNIQNLIIIYKLLQ